MQRFTVLSRALAATALVAGVAAAGVGTASAAVGAPVSITPTVSCDSETNAHVITWTVTNLTQGSIDTQGGNITDTGLTTGKSLDTFIRFFPSTMPAAGDISVGTSRADANAVGVIDLSLNLFVNTLDSSIQVKASVTLTDVCGAATPAPAPAPASTTTTAAASEAPAVTAVSAADGTLPHTGGGTSLVFPALLALLLGLGLALSARRPKFISYAVPAPRAPRSN
jgi:hypothetical protein